MFILTQFFTDASREISRRTSFCVVVAVVAVAVVSAVVVVIVVAVVIVVVVVDVGSRCEAMQSRNNILSM